MVLKRFTVLVISIVLLIGLFACSPRATDDKSVELAYVEWACATASIYVVQAVLQERMNYNVDITPVPAAVMWTALAAGDVDGITTAWLETTHGHYLEEVRDRVVDLGSNLKGTRIGLVVPGYVPFTSILDLEVNGEMIDYEIIGIDPGAGLMSATERVIEEYGLNNFTLIEGSDATMTAALSDAINNNRWVVVTGWTPHWKFGEWDLKYLEDPKGIYGGEEYIHTVVRQGLKEDMPEVYEFLDNFEWTPEDMQTVMSWNEDPTTDPYQNAVRWINENQNKVNEWLN